MSDLLVVIVVVGAVLNVTRPWHHRPRPLDHHDGAPATHPPVDVAIGGPLWGGAVVGAAVLAIPLVPVVVAWPSARSWWRRRVAVARHDRDVVRTLPDVVDIVLIGIRSGLNARAALVVAQPLLPPPWDQPVGDALRRAESGAPLAESLSVVDESLGLAARPLVSVLKTAALTGSGLTSQLEDLRGAAQRRRRVDAATRAQRLPVLMLGPLVLCVLPAFVLVAIAPLLMASLGDIRLVDIGLGDIGLGGFGP